MTCGVFSCVPVISTYCAPISIRRWAQTSIEGSASSSSLSARRRASGAFGVINVVCGSSISRIAEMISSPRQFVAAPGGEHRVENERNFRVVGNDLGNASTFSTLPRTPDLEWRQPACLQGWCAPAARPVSAPSACTLCTPTVSCTVMAVSAVSGWQPRLASVSRSAWTPAPDDGSLAAKDEHQGRARGWGRGVGH